MKKALALILTMILVLSLGACGAKEEPAATTAAPAATEAETQSVETTAAGAAYLAGLAVGYWKNQKEIQSNWSVDRFFAPDISPQEREQRIEGWRRAVDSCRQHS